MSGKAPFATRFFNGMERLYGVLAQMSGAKSDAFIDIMGVSGRDDRILVRDFGTLLSVIEINGLSSTVVGKDYNFFLDRVDETLRPYLTGGHSVQMVFKRDAQGFDDLIDNIFMPTRSTLKAMHLDWEWLLESRKEALRRYCADERVWLVLETNMGWATKEMMDAIRKDSQKSNADKLYGDDVLTNIEVSRQMADRHLAALESISDNFTEIGILHEQAPAARVLRTIRGEFDPVMTPDNWTPKLRDIRKGMVTLPDHPVDKKSVYRVTGGIMSPSIRQQVMPRAAQFDDNDNYVRIGDRLYAPMIVTLPPIQVKSFSEFMRALVSQAGDVPLRISIRLTPGALSRLAIKRFLSSFKFVRTNREISAAIGQMSELEAQGEAIVGLSMTLTTWVDARDDVLKNETEHAELARRVQKLVQVVQAWGEIEVSDVSGMPIWAVSSTIPGASRSDPAPWAAAPLPDVTPMLPLTRPGSPWRYGSLLFRTPDGKVMPFQPGSSLQPSWSMLCYAPPGSGKSVLLSTLMLGMIMAPGRNKLPYIGILDIGPSSKGLIDLIRSSLPEHERDLAIHVKPQNSIEYAINPFDLPLGFDRPSPGHKGFLSGFLSVLVAEKPTESPYRSVMDLLSTAIDMVYDNLSREKNPRLFDPTEDPELTDFVDQIGIHYDHATTWWDITDALFEKGYPDHAKRAQRFAMPTMTDLSVLVNSDDSLRTRFSNEIHGQPITAYVYSALRGAIQRYPILSSATRFTLDVARVVALDLMDVCPKGGVEEVRQTVAMYMLAKHVIASRFYVNEELAHNAPALYREYHLNFVREIGPEPKVLAMDEFQRTEGAPSIQKMVELDIREGRKFNVQIALFSQNPNDFTNVMAEYSTTHFILSDGQQPPDSAPLRKLQENMGLNDSDVLAIARMGAPTRLGASVYMIARIKQGKPVRLRLYNTVGPSEMWALETNAKNRTLRQEVVNQLGIRHGIEALAKRFPGGSAVEEIERLERQAGIADGKDEQGQFAIIRKLAEQVVEDYKKNMSA